MALHDLSGECAAARCHTPVTDSRLCPACVDLLRKHLGKLAGHPAAARVREDRPGPARTVPRQPGPWADGTRPGPDGTIPPATDTIARGDGPGQILDGYDDGLLADLEVTATRQDVTAPDTTRPPEEDPDGGERRTKDRPDLAPGATTLVFRPGASAVLSDARRTLRGITAAVLARRWRAELGDDGRALFRGERQYRAAGRVLGPWQDAPAPGRTATEQAAWVALYVWEVAQLEGAGRAADKVAEIVARADAVIVRPERQCLGPCGRCWDRDDGLAAIVYVYADQDATTAECPRCGQMFDVVAHRENMLADARGQWVTAPAAASALLFWARRVRSCDECGAPLPDARPAELTADQISGMGDRGRVAYRNPTSAEKDAYRAGGTRAPERLYLLGEVMDAIRDQHRDELRRRTARGKQGRRVPVEAGIGPRRAAG